MLEVLEDSLWKDELVHAVSGVGLVQVSDDGGSQRETGMSGLFRNWAWQGWNGCGLEQLVR